VSIPEAGIPQADSLGFLYSAKCRACFQIESFLLARKMRQKGLYRIEL